MQKVGDMQKMTQMKIIHRREGTMCIWVAQYCICTGVEYVCMYVCVIVLSVCALARLQFYLDQWA